jgi:hypothetical protein
VPITTLSQEKATYIGTSKFNINMSGVWWNHLKPKGIVLSSATHLGSKGASSINHFHSGFWAPQKLWRTFHSSEYLVGNFHH